MVAPDFIVPPPGLIPNAPEPADRPSSDARSARAHRSARPRERCRPRSRRCPLAGRAPPVVVPLPAARRAASRPSAPPRRRRPRPAPATSDASGPFRLSGPGGFEVLLTMPIVVGRDPVASGALHADARPVSVVDPARSVSKTHAVIDARDGRGDGHRPALDQRCSQCSHPRARSSSSAPGAPTEVVAGSTLYLGELGLRVRPALDRHGVT